MEHENSSIKIVVLSDTHLGFDYPVRPRINRRRRGYDFFNNFQYLLEFAVQTNADLILHCGDFFFRSKIPQPIVDKAYNILMDFAKNNIPIMIIPGNHERSLLPQSILTSHPNIIIHDKAGISNFKLKGKNIQITGMPFIRTNKNGESLDHHFQKSLESLQSDIDSSEIKLLALHQAIVGSKVGPADYTFRKGYEVLSKEAIPHHYDAILCGHIHRHQILYKTLNNSKIPIIFPGSIERTSFAEKDEQKGFMLLNIDQKNTITYRFEHLYARPMFDMKINPIFYDERSFIIWMTKKISKYPDDAILRIDPVHPRHYHYITAELLRLIIPETMNWSLKRRNQYPSV